MGILSAMEKYNHENLLFGQDRQSGLWAVIAIHDTTLGPALGGTRMWAYPSEEEAVGDVLRLARAMTYKAAVAGLDLGGGKAVIIGRPGQEKNEKLLRAFGRFVDTLKGKYITAADVGFRQQDIDVISQETPHVVGRDPGQGGSGDPSPFTAAGVLYGMKAIAQIVFGREKLAGKRVAVQGVGQVGYHLCRLLADEGAELVITDVNPTVLETAVRAFQARAVLPEDIFAVQCDIFAPCALGAVINDRTIQELNCRIIAGGANNVLAEERHGVDLLKRGIYYVPDYVINAGGLINVAEELYGYSRQRVLEKVARIYDTVTEVFQISKRKGVPPFQAANRLAEKRIARGKSSRPLQGANKVCQNRPGDLYRTALYKNVSSIKRGGGEMQRLATKEREFVGGVWESTINVRDFILQNYTPYDGDESFLAPIAPDTAKLWEKVKALFQKEREKGGMLDIATETIPSITAFAPAYVDRDMERIVGLQTDAPLKRAIKACGGLLFAERAAQEWGYEVGPRIKEVYSKYRKSHNEAVFQVYTPVMKNLKSSNLLVGVPDNFGRGRIIGDYRRLALYGVDRLIEDKRQYLERMTPVMTEENIRLREEIADQIRALQDLKTMAATYGYDVSRPARTAQEAIQWTYFGFLAMVKDEDSAACSLPQLDIFFDIFLERDLARGLITEEDAQALIDNFVIKVRMTRHLRPKVLAELMAADAIWATSPVGGVAEDGRHKITRTSYRLLHTLRTLGPAPEPNLTVLLAEGISESFRRYAAGISAATSAVQFQNDDIMRPVWGDDYGVACCVSAQRCGKEMQFFGARCNLPKLLLLAINGGREEINGELIGPEMPPLTGPYLNYDEVRERFSSYMDWFTEVYANTLNLVHFMHDKYYYERLQMALYDAEVKRYMAFGIAGLAVVADSLAAVRYAKVKPKGNGNGLFVDYEIEGDFPKYGNDDDRADEIAVGVVKEFVEKLRRFPLYRNAQHTLHLLTITWNVLYGNMTGNTPDGRRAGEPFPAGASPMHGRDTNGIIASLNSVAKIPYEYCRDGISNTLTIVPTALGKTQAEGVDNLASVLAGYFSRGAQHLNVNVVDRKTLEEAMEFPEKHPYLTVRVSGFAVNFVKLTSEQQREFMSRTFHTGSGSYVGSCG